jgi:hypothetical protein
MLSAAERNQYCLWGNGFCEPAGELGAADSFREASMVRKHGDVSR